MKITTVLVLLALTAPITAAADLESCNRALKKALPEYSADKVVSACRIIKGGCTESDLQMLAEAGGVEGVLTIGVSCNRVGEPLYKSSTYNKAETKKKPTCEGAWLDHDLNWRCP